MDANDVTFNFISPAQAEKMRKMLRDTVSPKQRAIVSQFLAHAERELKGIRVPVAKKGEDTAVATNEHSLLKKMELFRSVLSPIHQIPPEILTRIFAFNCAGTRLETSSIPSIPDIFSISHTCGRWREIILSTPFLWSDFVLSYCAFPGMASEREFEKRLSRLTSMVRLLLERSEKVPLTFLLTVYDERSDEMAEFLSLLAQSAERWKSLILFAEDCLRPFLHLLSRRLSSLQSLRLIWSAGTQSDRTYSKIVDLFEHCGSLTSVRLDFILSPEWSLLRLPWKQLTKLEVSSIDTPSLARLLGECPRLKDLTLDTCVYADPQTASPITLSHLEKLSMPECTNIPLMLRHFLLPKLTTLRFKDKYPDNSIKYTKYIEEFLQRSSCTITSLAFQLPELIRVEDILSLLRLFPSLQKLLLEGGAWDLNIRGILIPSFLSTLSSLLPRLVELVLHVEGHGSIVVESLLALVSITGRSKSDEKSAGAVVAGLRPLIILIKGRKPASAEDLANLKRLRDVGLRVDMFYVEHW
ncbi:hypothetical protein V5O48_010192 [Marasmius crinis-equi]|uniref:F-box domain-containing protein n=1 Tax=Marasmius crinis-equi TaxID=585013 RepID=A0ABR3F946_9AGAR